MRYITSIERLGPQEGHQKGRQEGLQEGERKGLIAAKQSAILEVVEVRFGEVPEGLREAVESLRDETRLSALLKSAIRAGSVGDFVRQVEDAKTEAP